MPSRPSSRPVTIQQHPGGVVRAGPSQKQAQSKGQAHHGSPPVEQAEEATPSPDPVTQALHPLSQSEAAQSEAPPPSEKSTSDIPLEDLSRKAKAVFSNATELFTSRKPSPGSESVRGRSSSYSPSRRARRSGSGSPKVRSGSPATTSSPARQRSKPGGQSGLRDRSGSCPVESDVSTTQAVTSFTTDTSVTSRGKLSEQPGVKTPRRIPKDITVATMSPPKSLTPAQEPRVSLVLNCDITPGLAAPGLGSPKLVPPADTDLVRMRSDTSCTVSEADSTSTYASSSVSDMERLPPLKPPTAVDSSKPVVGETNISADLTRLERATPGAASATNQLTRLAQIVQEHYSNMAEEPNTLEMRNVDAEMFPNVTDDVKKQS